MYKEDAYFCLTCFDLPTLQQFLEFALLHMDSAYPFQNIQTAGLISLLWRRICYWPVVQPPALVRVQSVNFIPPQCAPMCCCAVITSPSTISLFKCLVKSSVGRPPYCLQWQNQSIERVRPLWRGLSPRPALAAFSPLLIGRSIGVEPKLLFF
jgi:hypothetical protein